MKKDDFSDLIVSSQTISFLYKSEDQIFSEIYSAFFNYPKEKVFLNNEKTIFINKKIKVSSKRLIKTNYNLETDKKIQNNKIFILVVKISKVIFITGLLGYLTTHQLVLGGSPFAAITVTPSRPHTTVAQVMTVLPEKPSARVVISGMRPQMQLSARRASMGYKQPITTAKQLLTKKASSLSSVHYITNSYQIRQYFGAAFQIHSGPNNNVIWASAMVEDIFVANVHIIQNCPTGISPVDVETQMARFIKTLANDPALSALNTSINYQGWTESNSENPVLTFNTDATHGRYKYSSNMAVVMRSHIEAFIQNYPDLAFQLAYRGSDSDHINQKHQLLSLGIQKKNGWAYHLEKWAHVLKSKIDLPPPSNDATIRDLFISNADLTYGFLEKLYHEGKLINSVENIEQFKTAVYACAQNDLASAEALGVADLGPSHNDAVTTLSTGSDELKRFTIMIGATPKEDLDKESVKKHLNIALKGARERAACASHANYSNSSNPRLLNMQDTEVQDFKHRLKLLVDKAFRAVPELALDTTFSDKHQEVKDILSGKTSYLHIIEEDTYNDLITVFRNPKRHKALFARTASITISGNRYGSSNK